MSKDLRDDAAAHSRAKHQILEEYLKAWLPILGRGQTNRLLYFDGFAGCGELEGGHPGSPIVAIRAGMAAASTHQTQFEVRMVEKEPERCGHLRQLVERERSNISQVSARIQIADPVCQDCETAIEELLREHQHKRLGPALFFLDQYGYSGFPMDLVRRILAHDMCETFSYLNWSRLHPYFSDDTKAATITRAIGGEEWRDVVPLRGQERVDRFKAIYLDALRRRAGAKYVYDFAMRGPDHRLVYWLFFCTNSLKGLEVMKKAMWKVDSTGRFEFSDRDKDQAMLLTYSSENLAEDLYRELKGKKMTPDQLKEHVLTQTPEYRYDDAIAILKTTGRVKEDRKSRPMRYSFQESIGSLFQ